MPVTSNLDRTLDLIFEIFVEYDNWLTFRQLATRLTGDPSNEQLIARIVDRHSGVLVVADGCRCKLRTGFIQDPASMRIELNIRIPRKSCVAHTSALKGGSEHQIPNSLQFSL